MAQNTSPCSSVMKKTMLDYCCQVREDRPISNRERAERTVESDCKKGDDDSAPNDIDPDHIGRTQDRFQPQTISALLYRPNDIGPTAITKRVYSSVPLITLCSTVYVFKSYSVWPKPVAGCSGNRLPVSFRTFLDRIGA